MKFAKVFICLTGLVSLNVFAIPINNQIDDKTNPEIWQSSINYLNNHQNNSTLVEFTKDMLAHKVITESDIQISGDKVVIKTTAGNTIADYMLKSLCYFGTGERQSWAQLYAYRGGSGRTVGYYHLFTDDAFAADQNLSYPDKTKYSADEYNARVQDINHWINYVKQNGKTYYCYASRQSSTYNEDTLYKDKDNLLFAIVEQSTNLQESYIRDGNSSSVILTKPLPAYLTYYAKPEAKKILEKNYQASKNSSFDAYLKAQYQNQTNQKTLEQQQLANNMKTFRTKLQPGDDVNCGTVIEVKGKMVHVQTGSDARDIWIANTNIFPQNIDGKIVGCKDSNRWYKRYGNWVQAGGNNYYRNDSNYNDDILN
ncbi:MAG: hypothetical protein E6Q32_09035 [Neisseriales bacterium]|nr:MAG: hypothetical protein E6Q32_09035 [Neisseriales bacterium]